MRKEESRGYESLDDCLRGGMGKGSLGARLRCPVPDCVDVRLLQRALFPRNPQSESVRPGQDSRWFLALLRWGLRRLPSTPEVWRTPTEEP